MKVYKLNLDDLDEYKVGKANCKRISLNAAVIIIVKLLESQ